MTRITWYQTIPSGTPQNLRPDGTFTAERGAVGVRSGYGGYLVDAIID